ncbi:MAG TPA: GNAT family N-acetyltransferase [Phycisphaerales bacterium]|nr:GNAT family N-acetyltransferase [Phycisphaerales bacterium]
MGRIEPQYVTLRDGGRVLLRCAEPQDAEALEVFTEHADRTSEHNVTRPGERRRTLEQVRERLAQSLADEVSIHVFAVEAGSGEIIGLINFKGNEQSRIRHWGMLGISVSAEHRSRGIGTALIRALLEWARANEHIERVGLQVFEPNLHARALYEKMGFKEDCRRERYIKMEDGTYVADIEMSVWVK